MAEKTESLSERRQRFAAYIFFLFWVLACVYATFKLQYTKVDGTWTINTPLPTPTSDYYKVVADITSVELKGDDFSGYTTWLTIKIRKTRFNEDIGKDVSYRLPSSEYAILRNKVGSRIVIETCLNLDNGFAHCTHDYFLKE